LLRPTGPGVARVRAGVAPLAMDHAQPGPCLGLVGGPDHLCDRSGSEDVLDLDPRSLQALLEHCHLADEQGARAAVDIALAGPPDLAPGPPGVDAERQQALVAGAVLG